MQHVCARCQSCQAAPHAQKAEHPAEPETVTLVSYASDQHISTTCSRRLRDPEEFIDAVTFMTGHHPRANATTLKVARDIADRMPASKDGHVAYALAGMQQRLGLGRSTVMEHVAILREMGVLCWVEHGSLRNALRTRLGNRFTAGVGYRATATIYAPCAPPAYDRARGRIREGGGYHSRIRGYTPAGRATAIAEARRRSAHRTPSSSRRTPHSPAGRGEGSKDSATPKRRTTTTSREGGSTGVTAQQAAVGMAHAQRVQLEVWWTQGTCVRQLAYALRPLTSAGYGWREIARELTSWRVPQRPTHASAYIRAGLRRRAHTGLLHLPEGSVTPFRQVPSDDAGERHTSMIERRRQQFAPAFARYRDALAGTLRTALRNMSSPPTPRPARPRPQQREPDHLFRAALGAAAAQDVYRARAWARSDPARRLPDAEQEKDLWAELAEHAQAAAACARLRDALAGNARLSDAG